MDGEATSGRRCSKRLRSRMSGKGGPRARPKASAGAQQMKMLRRLPQILRFIPGTARTCASTSSRCSTPAAGSQDNVAGMVRLLVDRYAAGRAALRDLCCAGAPIDYPEVGVYHPAIRRSREAASPLPPARAAARARRVLLLMRSYLLPATAPTTTA